MGKVIKKKIQGMSLWAKISLVTTLTLLVSVFMYQGWYLPTKVHAATVTYGVTVPSTASTGVDGAAQMPTGGAQITTAPTVRGNMSTTVTTSGASYRPTTGMANGTAVTLLRLYSPAYATAQTITAPSGSFAIRGYNTNDTWTFHIYSHNPAGTAGNKTLLYSSNTTTSGTGATVTVTPTYTLVSNVMPATHKLLVEVVYRPGGTTYTPRVYLDGTASSSWSRITVTETAAAQPTISGVSPNNLTQGATAASVTITGTNLTAGTVSFSNGGVTGGTPTTNTATSIVLPVTVASNAATGAGTITVTTAGGSANSTFTVNAAPAPTVTSTSPNSMVQGAGPTTVTINGTNFINGATVTFSGTGVTPGAATLVSSTQLTVPVTVAAGAATGARNVTVTLPGGQAGTGTGVFTVIAATTPPTISTVSPSSLAQGATNTSITITGTNLTGGAVSFSNPGVTGGTPTTATATQIVLPVSVTPGAATGAGTLTVTTTGGSVNSAFSVTAAANPTVTSTSPNSMTQGSGPTTVAINGTNFLIGATVAFSGTGVTTGAATYVSSTQLTVPVTVAAGATTGARNVTVTLPGGQTGTGTGVFTVNVAGSCTVGSRTMTITPNIFVVPGGVATYTITVTNGDSGTSCANLPVTLTRGTPTNTTDFVTSALSKTSLSVPPGGTDSATFTATANAGAANGVTSSTTVTSSVTTTTPNNVTATTTVTLFSTPLMHSGANLGAKYSGGTWGSGKDCTWCHTRTTSNVKRVTQTINTPSGNRTVTFTRMTAVRTNNAATGVFGNDNRTYAVNASTNVCEVCHHQTTYHQYSSSKITAGNKNHNSANNTDCTSCHKHAAGFSGGGACDSCHGNPPGALVSPATGIANAGAHTKHTVRGITCDACHINNGMPATDSKITIGYSLNAANWPTFRGTVSYGSYTGLTLINGYTFAAGNATTAVATSATGRNSCNVYCHGNWAGANGSNINHNPSWTAGATQAACGTCHGATAAQPPTSGSHTKHSSSAAYNISCDVCHIYNTDNTHVEGNVHWKLHLQDLRVGLTATYRGISSGKTGNIAPSASFGNCANIYCHSNGVAASPTYVTTLTWGVPSTGACGTCHGVLAATPPASAAHIKHIGSASGYQYSCSKCHSDVVSATANSTTVPTVINNVLHVDRSLTTAYDTFNPGATSCTTTYCHSQGTGATGQTGDARPALGPITAPNWTMAASCSMCHTGGTTTGPTYASGSPKANTHLAHTAAGIAYTCDVCHFATTTNGTTVTTAANHVNKVYNVSANTAKTPAFTYTYVSTGGTCSATSCHGARTVTWGTTLAGTTAGCNKCHSSTAPATTFMVTDGTTNTAKSVIHVSHVNRTHTMMTSGSGAITCASCHTVPGAAITAGHMDTALPADVAASYSLPGGGPFSLTYTGTYPTATCSTYCHGSTLATNSPTPPAGVVIAPTFGTTLLTGVASNDCGKCHAYPPLAITDHAGKLPADCKTCHPHVNAAGTGFDVIALHIDGKVDAVGGDCTGCHAQVQGGRRTDVMKQFTSVKNSHHYQGAAKISKTVCYSCHWESDATGATTTHHREQTAGFRNKVQLVVWGTSTTRPTAYTAGTTYVLYSSGGTSASTRTELAKINTHCIGCHNDANKNTATFPGDTNTPSKYSWEAKATTAGGFGAAQSIAAKYSQTTTTLWGKFAGNYTNAKNGVVKALAGHGNSAVNQRGWSTLAENLQSATAVANFPNTSGTGNVLCFDCHNSHGSKTPAATANAVTSTYSSATGRGRGGIPKDTTAGQGGYANTYRSYSGGNATQKNVYRAGAGLCFDCHNNAATGAATSTGNTTPWGYNATFGATQGIFGYNDSPYFGKTGGTFAKAITWPFLASISANDGGHFGASSALTHTPLRRVNGLCSTCHDPHGVSPALGTNQQYAVPMLKNTFVTSPYKQDIAPLNQNYGGGDAIAQLSGATAGYHIDQNTLQAGTAGSPTTALRWAFATAASTLNTLNDTQFAGLCTGCHTKANINSTAAASSANWKTPGRIHNSVKGWASTGGGNAGNVRHAYTCSKCHSTHNSYLPRMLVTNCLDIKHRNRVVSGGTFPAALTGSNRSGDGLGRFPGGGGAALTGGRATAPGPWWFGTSGVAATQTCHDSATAGGTTYSAAGQLWNTKGTW